jgi:hypothetical protein
MPINVHNPYGAVPNALKDTRLTLRDIGRDIVAEKQNANQMALATSEQDIRRAKTMSDIETDKQRRAETAARLYGQNLQNQQLARTIQEQNKVITAGEFAGRVPGGKHLLPLFGIDPKEKRTVAEWTPVGQQLAGIMQKSPYIAFQASQFNLKGEIDEIDAKLAQKGLDETTKSKLIEQKKKIGRQYLHNDRLINRINEPKPADLGKEWDKSADLQLTYPDKQQYIDASIQAHRAVNADAKNMQMNLVTAEIDPQYTQTMRDAQQIIASKIPNRQEAEKILNNIDALIAKNDFAGAYNLAKSWAEKLGAPASGAPGTTAQRPPTGGTRPPGPVKTIGQIPAMTGQLITDLKAAFAK